MDVVEMGYARRGKEGENEEEGWDRKGEEKWCVRGVQVPGSSAKQLDELAFGMALVLDRRTICWLRFGQSLASRKRRGLGWRAKGGPAGLVCLSVCLSLDWGLQAVCTSPSHCASA